MESLTALESLPEGFQTLGITGWPLEHSLSVPIQNAALDDLNLPYRYLPFPVSESRLEALVSRFKNGGGRGLNVTIPYKEKIMAFLDGVSNEAGRIGAVNTLVFSDGKAWGENTDSAGFLSAWELEVGVDIAGRKATILGSGGAARAVAFAMAAREAESITIISRNEAKGKILARDLEHEFSAISIREFSLSDREALAGDLLEADFLVNATPLGMFPGAGGTPVSLPAEVNPSLLVYDLVYNPLRTTLMREADSRGLPAYNGLEMLIQQGALSFEIWTGKKPSLSVMRSRALEILKS
jgi:shikimate dehydrogenase